MTRAELIYRPTVVSAVVPIGPDAMVDCPDPSDPSGDPIRVAVEGRPEVGDPAEVAWVAPSRAWPEGRWSLRPVSRAGQPGGAGIP